MAIAYSEKFTKHDKIVDCLNDLKSKFDGAPPGKKPLVVSDVIDGNGHQYVHLVQKGGGVLGVALLGFTYILGKWVFALFASQAPVSARLILG